MKKIYIYDFCDELNFMNVILYIHEEVDFQELYKKLSSDLVNHLRCFDLVMENRLFYIENCDLQDIDDRDVAGFVAHGYALLQLRKDSVGFYVEVPDLL